MLRSPIRPKRPRILFLFTIELDVSRVHLYGNCCSTLSYSGVVGITDGELSKGMGFGVVAKYSPDLGGDNSKSWVHLHHPRPTSHAHISNWKSFRHPTRAHFERPPLPPQLIVN